MSHPAIDPGGGIEPSDTPVTPLASARRAAKPAPGVVPATQWDGGRRRGTH